MAYIYIHIICMYTYTHMLYILYELAISVSYKVCMQCVYALCMYHAQVVEPAQCRPYESASRQQDLQERTETVVPGGGRFR